MIMSIRYENIDPYANAHFGRAVPLVRPFKTDTLNNANQYEYAYIGYPS